MTLRITDTKDLQLPDGRC